MKRSAANRPLGSKMAWISMVTAGAALLVASVALIVFQFLALRGALADDLRVQARIVGSNSSAALMFRDSRAGEETLAALAMSPQVTAASIFDAAGETLAFYHRDNAPQLATPASALLAAGYDYHLDYLDVAEPVRVNNQQAGVVRIRASLEPLYARLATYAGLTWPSCAQRQRSSASTPTTRPLASSICGW